jgi:hypothetical protein
MKRGRDSKLRALRLRRVRRITAGLVHHQGPAWSADARLIASRLGEGSESYWVVVDRKGRVARVLEGPACGRASFAPDGSLAYGRQVGATSEIWEMPSGGGAPRRILGGDGRLYRDPAYSPDGRYLAYTADDGQDGAARRLWLLDLVHDDHRLLVGEPLRVSHPAWSRSDGRLYFEATPDDGGAIYCASPTSSEIERLTAPGYHHPAPLSPGLLLCEHSGSDADPNAASALLLIDHRQKDVPPQVRSILGEGAREPAVAWSKQSVLLAWSMPCRAAPDEPNRCDIHVGRLIGLPTRRGAKKAPPPPEPSSSAGGDDKADGSSPTEARSSVCLDRPLVGTGTGAP